MELLKFIAGMPSLAVPRDEAEERVLLEVGFRPVVTEDDKPECGKYETIEADYEEQDDGWRRTWHKKKDEAAIAEDIQAAKEQLASTDYYIIKQFEATLTGQPLPYDAETMTQVTTRRTKLRELINSLEG